MSDMASEICYRDGQIFSGDKKIAEVSRQTSGVRTTLIEVKGDQLNIRLERQGGGSFRIDGSVTGRETRGLKVEVGGETYSPAPLQLSMFTTGNANELTISSLGAASATIYRVQGGLCARAEREIDLGVLAVYLAFLAPYTDPVAIRSPLLPSGPVSSGLRTASLACAVASLVFLTLPEVFKASANVSLVFFALFAVFAALTFVFRVIGRRAVSQRAATASGSGSSETRL